jgi:eukaryotic-like serine/threonine-protein kinase
MPTNTESPLARTAAVTATFVPESSAQATDELQLLLRKRLRTLALVFALLSGTFTVVFFWSRVFPVLLRGGSVRAAVWTGLALYALAVTISAVGARVLWSRTPLSLDRLRAFELAGFAIVAAIEVWRIFATLRAGSVFDHVSRDAVGMMLLASRQSLIWFGLIVAYGMFIPNTWRRCAAVVGLMALTPLASTAIANSLYGVLDGRLLFRFLSEVAMSMVFAVALAIYGSHRIEVLRREAFQARKLGQYQLKQPIGSGGMGDVYLAEHVLLRRPCAIKLIQPDRARDPNRLVRFEREVQATATLTHPNTVQVFDYGHTEDGTFYYVMEYLPGLTLDQLVKRHGPVSVARMIHILRQVCGALAEAHGIGLIHRDIKPGNIIVCERGGLHDVAKLLDFGIVQALDMEPKEPTLTQEGSIAGTPAFMSPEQAAGQQGVDGRSDIYSLGAVAYFLLTGQPPFLRDTVMRTLAAHISEPVVPLDRLRSDLPSDVQAVVLRCLEKNPLLRFPDATSLRLALAKCKDAGEWNLDQPARVSEAQTRING